MDSQTKLILFANPASAPRTTLLKCDGVKVGMEVFGRQSDFCNKNSVRRMSS